MQSFSTSHGYNISYQEENLMRRFSYRRLMTASTSEGVYRWYVGATFAMSTLLGVTFSSMTCFKIESAIVSASCRVMSLLYCSCKELSAPSDPEPMALALHCQNVPDGSV
uniref:Proteasome subunit alpha type-5 n=1 Tax=Rhizophora mucronata TaxID=61149 RepID=A0A2P2IJG7_RHIMU